MNRSLEVLSPTFEFRPELAPERDMCLESLLAQAQARLNDGFDAVADQHLIEGINDAVITADESHGMYTLRCQQAGCEADAVMVLRQSGPEGSLEVLNPEELSEDCLYNQ